VALRGIFFLGAVLVFRLCVFEPCLGTLWEACCGAGVLRQQICPARRWGCYHLTRANKSSAAFLQFVRIATLGRGSRVIVQHLTNRWQVLSCWLRHCAAGSETEGLVNGQPQQHVCVACSAQEDKQGRLDTQYCEFAGRAPGKRTRDSLPAILYGGRQYGRLELGTWPAAGAYVSVNSRLLLPPQLAPILELGTSSTLPLGSASSGAVDRPFFPPTPDYLMRRTAGSVRRTHKGRSSSPRTLHRRQCPRAPHCPLFPLPGATLLAERPRSWIRDSIPACATLPASD
jgi:hypothetical protein